MREFIKYCLLSSFLLLFCLPLLQSQNVSIVQYRSVSAEDRAEFLHRETTYWSEVARAAIKEDKMVGWELWEKVGGWNLSESSNFIFVNTFAKPEDLNNTNAIWNPAKVFPNRRISEIETNSLSTLNHMLVFQGGAYAGTGKTPDFVRVNYAKASNLSKYLELEKTNWQPFIKKHIDAGTTTQVNWFSASVVMPTGSGLPFNAITSDGYSTLSEAMFPRTSFKELPTLPDMTEISKTFDRVRVEVYRRVKTVYKE